MIQWTSYLSTAATANPVTVAEAKTHCRIDDATDDAYVERLIGVATEWAQAYTKRQLINATWILTLDRFPSIIQLPRSPLSSVTFLTYKTTAGKTTTLTEDTDYEVFDNWEPPQIRECYGTTWPTTRDATLEAVSVQYVAGYGTASTDVPEGIRHAIFGAIELMFAYRSPVITGVTVNQMHKATMAALDQYKVDFDVPWLSSSVQTYSAT